MGTQAAPRPLDHADPNDGAAAFVRLAHRVSLEQLDAMSQADMRNYHNGEFARLMMARLSRTTWQAFLAWTLAAP